MASMKKRVEETIEQYGFSFDGYLTSRDGQTWGDYSIGLPRDFVHMDKNDERTGLSGMVDASTHMAWKYIMEDVTQMIANKPWWVRKSECAQECCNY
jgi:hypothetical protein